MLFIASFIVIFKGVESIEGEATFKLVVKLSTPQEIENSTHRADSPSQITTDVEVPSGSYRCGNCLAVLANEKMVMHERHCAKR
jgi:hypothetical protein